MTQGRVDDCAMPGSGGLRDIDMVLPPGSLLNPAMGEDAIAGAVRNYGVAVIGDPDHDPEGLRIDAEASAKLRNTGGGHGA